MLVECTVLSADVDSTTHAQTAASLLGADPPAANYQLASGEIVSIPGLALRPVGYTLAPDDLVGRIVTVNTEVTLAQLNRALSLMPVMDQRQETLEWGKQLAQKVTIKDGDTSYEAEARFIAFNGANGLVTVVASLPLVKYTKGKSTPSVAHVQTQYTCRAGQTTALAVASMYLTEPLFVYLVTVRPM